MSKNRQDPNFMFNYWYRWKWLQNTLLFQCMPNGSHSSGSSKSFWRPFSSLLEGVERPLKIFITQGNSFVGADKPSNLLLEPSLYQNMNLNSLIFLTRGSLVLILFGTLQTAKIQYMNISESDRKKQVLREENFGYRFQIIVREQQRMFAVYD